MNPRTAPGNSQARQPAARSPVRGRGRPRDEQAEQAVIDATIAILDEAGFAGLSIEAAAARAGVSRPTIYRRWPTKLDLAVDAVLRTAPPLDVTETADPRADLHRLISGLVTEMTSAPVGRVAAAALTSGDAGSESLTRKLNEVYLQPGRAAITGVLQRAVTQGILRDDLDTDLLLDLMLGVPAYRWLTTGKPVDAATTQAAIDLIWQAALRQAAPGSGDAFETA
jgi:AcrR family transcriptional regulator